MNTPAFVFFLFIISMALLIGGFTWTALVGGLATWSGFVLFAHLLP